MYLARCIVYFNYVRKIYDYHRSFLGIQALLHHCFCEIIDCGEQKSQFRFDKHVFLSGFALKGIL